MFARFVRDQLQVVVATIAFDFAPGQVSAAALNVNPRDLWVDFFGTLAESWGRFIRFITESAGWAIEYFLLGAVLVIPIWIVFRILRTLGRE